MWARGVFMLTQVVHTVATVPKRLTFLVTNCIVQNEINYVCSENDEGRCFPHLSIAVFLARHHRTVSG